MLLIFQLCKNIYKYFFILNDNYNNISFLAIKIYNEVILSNEKEQEIVERHVS
jgi:hypothetical protein